VSAVPVARLFGFEIRVHVSWAVILAVIAVTVVTQLEAAAPSTTQPVRWLLGSVVAAAFLLSALAHELGHAVVARRAGAPGKVVVVFFFGGAASPTLELSRPRDEIRAALAGPLVSLAIGAVFAAIAFAASGTPGTASLVVAQVSVVIAILNLVLGGANLLPAFPLDGGRIARGLLWARTGDASTALRGTARLGRWLGILLGVIGFAVILRFDSIDGLMLALAGWFLISTARALERGADVDAMLEGLLVADVMDRDVTRVPAGLTLDTFADQVLRQPGGSVPVVQDGDLVGMLGERQVRRIRRDRWGATRAGEAMTARSALPEIEPSTTVRSALDQLHRSGADGLPVFEAGSLTGIITRHAVSEAVRERVRLKGTPA
jgi:Zn-dependent protease/predicted transcriptional regulator